MLPIFIYRTGPQEKINPYIIREGRMVVCAVLTMQVILTPGDDIPSEPYFDKLPFYSVNRRLFRLQLNKKIP